LPALLFLSLKSGFRIVQSASPQTPRRFDLLIFDWDGTLMDSAGVIAACIQAASRDMQLPVPSREDASHVIGLGLREAL